MLVELGTYSGSSFAAFCQAMQACGVEGRCYGIDLWEGDVHMGKFDETLYREIADYLAAHYPGIATLVRKDFDAASADFADGSIDLLHIDGTHTFEAVRNDFHTWLPKMSERGVVLFHDVNVNVREHGPGVGQVRREEILRQREGSLPALEFLHCWGLGVLVVGSEAPAEVLELVAMSRSPEFAAFFAAKGGLVSKRFEEMGVALPVHTPYGDTPPPPPPPPPAPPQWRRALGTIKRILAGAPR